MEDKTNCYCESCGPHHDLEISRRFEKERDAALLQLGEIPKKILEAVNAEQLRCGKIAEAFWNGDDKLNADLRVKLTQAETSMAYTISTNIRAMRWREENFTEKQKCDHRCNSILSGGKMVCSRCGEVTLERPKREPPLPRCSNCGGDHLYGSTNCAEKQKGGC